MTNKERERVLILKQQGLGYKRIASTTGISINTVKSFLRKQINNSTDKSQCLNCCKPIIQTPHKKKRKFCSDTCRNSWWSAHPEKRKEKPYKHICLYCHKAFSSDRPASKYCSTACYAEARKGVKKI